MDARTARLRTEHPVLTLIEDGVERPLTRKEYDARIAEWAANEAAHEAEAVARQAAQDERDILLAALESGKATDQQVRAALAYLLRREMGQ